MIGVMVSLKAHVQNGRLVLDAPTDLPDGTEVELVPADSWDDLNDEDRKKLLAALAKSDEDVTHGRVRPAGEVLAGLRSGE